MARTPPNAADLVANYGAGFNGTAQNKFKSAIGRVTSNPMQDALAKVNDGTWLTKVTASVDKLKNALSNADPAFWKSQTQGAGATNWLNSKTKALAKYNRKANLIAQAAQQASQAAAAAGSSSRARWEAAVNATMAVFGAGTVS